MICRHCSLSICLHIVKQVMHETNQYLLCQEHLVVLSAGMMSHSNPYWSLLHYGSVFDVIMHSNKQTMVDTSKTCYNFLIHLKFCN